MLRVSLDNSTSSIDGTSFITAIHLNHTGGGSPTANRRNLMLSPPEFRVGSTKNLNFLLTVADSGSLALQKLKSRFEVEFIAKHRRRADMLLAAGGNSTNRISRSAAFGVSWHWCFHLYRLHITSGGLFLGNSCLSKHCLFNNRVHRWPLCSGSFARACPTDYRVEIRSGSATFEQCGLCCCEIIQSVEHGARYRKKGRPPKLSHFTIHG